MNSSPTLQTLQLDCILEILKYFSLRECMPIRSTCKQLKTAVDERFRSFKTLPVLLSACYSPEYVEQHNRHYNKHPFSEYKKLTYGSTSGASQLKMWEYPKKFQYQENLFRFEEYLILFDSAKFPAFIDFITKYLPGVTKLALVLDHDDHLEHIPMVLNVFRKQLKVLLLKRTLRVEYEICDFKNGDVYEVNNNVNLSEKLLYSVCDLEKLEELYFFSNKYNTIHFPTNPNEAFEQFLEKVFSELRILHIPDDSTVFWDYEDYFRSKTFEELEELACSSLAILDNNVSFPWLKKFICLSSGTIENLDSNLMPNLREVCLPYHFYIMPESMENLNTFPYLERIQCVTVFPVSFPELFSNNTVKIIEMEELNSLYEDESENERKQFAKESLQKLLSYLPLFKALEKFTIRKSAIELTKADFQRVGTLF